MSGPKVVRIVTREELEATCRGHLAQLDEAVAEWVRVAARNGTASDEDVARVHRRAAELAALMGAERFMDLQKGVPAEISFLRADQEARLTRAAEAQAEARSARRRTASVAASLLARLDAAGGTPPALRDRVAAVAGGGDDPGALAEAFARLAPAETGEAGASERQRALAARLGEGEARATVAQWVATQPPPSHDAAVTRLEARLASLSVLLGAGAAEAFEARLAAAAGAPPARQPLLLDSLEVDLAAAVRAARARTALQARVRGLAAELEAAGDAGLAALAAECRARIEEGDAALAELETRAAAARDAYHATVAARARRSAVLTGLAGLGYAVTEEMETAWVQDGRVVIRSAARPGYGVEIAGGAGATRLQLRTVAFRAPGAGHDPMRDADAETLWCGDLHALEARLAALGGGLHIEVAKPVGAVPLKEVEDASAAPHVQATAPLRQRGLP